MVKLPAGAAIAGASLILFGGAGPALVAGCANKPKKQAASSAPEVSSTVLESTTVPEPTTTTTLVPTTVATTVPPPTTVAPVVPGPLVAPTPGSYVYETTVTREGRTYGPGRSTAKVDAGVEGGTPLRTITIPPELSYEGTDYNFEAWGPAGVVVRRSLPSSECTWQPPWVRYVGDLAVGKEWSYDTRCAESTTAYSVRLKGTRKVTSAQVTTVAGRQVATWTIAIDETRTSTSTRSTTSLKAVGTEELAPSLGMHVAKSEVFSGTASKAGVARAFKLVSLP